MNLGVVGNPRYADLSKILKRLHAVAPSFNFSLHTEQELKDMWPAPLPVLSGTDGIDLLVTFGGDGTLLRGARYVAGTDVPIMGINLGRVGFLTTSSLEGMENAFQAYVDGEYTIESRGGLETSILSPEGEAPGELTLNDVVVHKGGVARVLRFRVGVDGEVVGQYSADGIIVATATGSTAYSMSAGGPIVVPGVDAVVITAICPHTLAVRPIVVPASAQIRIEQLAPYTDEVLVSYDGQWDTTLAPGDVVCVRRAESRIRMIRVGTEGFFDRVRNKLQWGDLSDREQV